MQCRIVEKGISVVIYELDPEPENASTCTSQLISNSFRDNPVLSQLTLIDSSFDGASYSRCSSAAGDASSVVEEDELRMYGHPTKCESIQVVEDIHAYTNTFKGMRSFDTLMSSVDYLKVIDIEDLEDVNVSMDCSHVIAVGFEEGSEVWGAQLDVAESFSHVVKVLFEGKKTPFSAGVVTIDDAEEFPQGRRC